MLHTVIHWIFQQLAMTWQQITVDVTIPHIITGIILYCIVHTASKRGSRKALDVEKVFKSHVQRVIHRHVHERHGGHPLTCETPECKEALEVVKDPTPR